MKYRIVEYKNYNNLRFFRFDCQIQKSFFGFKYWYTFRSTDYFEFAQRAVDEHKLSNQLKPEIVIHNID